MSTMRRDGLPDDKPRGPATAAPNAADLLRGVPAFSGLAENVRQELAARCELRTFRAGAPLLPSGVRWAGVGVVLSGEARLLD